MKVKKDNKFGIIYLVNVFKYVWIVVGKLIDIIYK